MSRWTVVTQAQDFGEFAIRIAADEYTMQFEAFEACARGMFEDSPYEYQRRGDDGFTTDIDEAEPHVCGTIKWDGCCNYEWGGTDGGDVLLHRCGVECFGRDFVLFRDLYALAEKHIARWSKK